MSLAQDLMALRVELDGYRKRQCASYPEAAGWLGGALDRAAERTRHLAISAALTEANSGLRHGRIECRDGRVRHVSEDECPNCEGRGGHGLLYDGSYAERCEECKGEGVVIDEECRCSGCWLVRAAASAEEAE